MVQRFQSNLLQPLLCLAASLTAEIIWHPRALSQGDGASTIALHHLALFIYLSADALCNENTVTFALQASQANLLSPRRNYSPQHHHRHPLPFFSSRLRVI